MVKIAIFAILAILPPGACPSGTVRATRPRDLAARPGPPARTAWIRTRPQIRWIWGRVGPDFDDPGHTKPDWHTLVGCEVRFSPAGVGVLAVL